MFRDELQQNRFCQAVLGLQLRSRGLWDDHGPTELGISMIADKGGKLSRGERTLLAIAVSVTSSRDGSFATIGELLELDDDNLKRVAEGLYALSRGSEALDAWLRWQGWVKL